MDGPVVYLVLSHRDVGQVARLAGRLVAGDPSCHVVVHHDGPVDAFAREPAAADARVHVLQAREPTTWGGFAMVRATYECLRWIGATWSPSWVAVISGQDYPVLHPRAIGELLRAGGHDAYLEVEGPVSAHAENERDRYMWLRYFFRWWRLPDGGVEWVRRALASRRFANAAHRLTRAQRVLAVWPLPRGGGAWVGLRRLRTPFDADHPCWVGSSWIVLGSAALRAVTEPTERKARLFAHYERTLLADESLLTTLVRNTPGLRIAPHNLTYAVWTDGAAHPRGLGASDLPAAFASGRAFARKFEPSADPGVLDRIDAAIGLGDPSRS